jgi:hypothetical protein
MVVAAETRQNGMIQTITSFTRGLGTAQHLTAEAGIHAGNRNTQIRTEAALFKKDRL